MKALKVCHQLGVSGVGEEQYQPECLHEKPMSKDDDATTGVATDEPTDCFAGTIEKKSERLGVGAVAVCGVFPLPVGGDVGFAIPS